MTKFVVRHLIGSVNKKWLEEIYSSEIERTAIREYERLIAENPDEYFELVRTEYSEECLKFTPKIQ